MIAYLTLIDDFDLDRLRTNWVYLLSLGHPYVVKDSFFFFSIIVQSRASPCKDVAILYFYLSFFLVINHVESSLLFV